MNNPTQVSETVTYSLDLAGGLSQVLSDGSNTYTYGYNRIAQTNEDITGYFLGDALGSVRQVIDGSAEIVLSREYTPYGETLASLGSFSTDFGYTGELTDGTGLINLRARYYDPSTGRFLTKDSWAGDSSTPATLVKWLYANSNPVMYTDPSGNITEKEGITADKIVASLNTYGITVVKDWSGIYSYAWVYLDPTDRTSRVQEKTLCSWNPGLWSLNELYIVLGAAQNFNKATNNHLNQILGNVTMKKVALSGMPSNCQSSGVRGCTGGSMVYLADKGLLPSSRPSNVNDLSDYYVVVPGDQINFDQWSVVHEFGHVWENSYNANHNSNIINLFLRETGGKRNTPAQNCSTDYWKPGCNAAQYFYGDIPAKGADIKFTPREDFAESVASYVFPVQAQQVVERKYGQNPNSDIYTYLFYSDFSNTKRWSFVNNLVDQY